ncbi:hypothetical protein Y1Q_0011017 [Alligator mississippiensis]|uniref:Ig-like domain-containing protein n=1 Tax=Alligator mississippiensis TaxID=8496 RepID=A0A151P1I7_ALLMI|nr:hypothetical protein Y1Q_0011017 [Alligator mississippiensis]
MNFSARYSGDKRDDGARARCVFLHEVERIREERVSPEIRVWARPHMSEIQVLPEWDPRDKVPFAVQLHNFYPREVPPIQWGWDGAGSWREDPAQIYRNADGTFTATSVWRVPSRSLTRPELQVRVCVQHGPGEPASERELSLRAAGLLRPPDVSKISQTESVDTGKGVTLRCCVVGHFPEKLSVTWLRRGKGEATAVILRDSAVYRVEPGTAVLARDGKSFQQETRLTRWTSRDQGAEYICRVGHLTLETPIERSIICDPCPPDLGQVSQTQEASDVARTSLSEDQAANGYPGSVISYTVSEVHGPQWCLLGQEVTLHCSMEGTFPEDVTVTWERIHSEDRTVPESAGDQESPKHQPLFPALPPGWRVTEERAGTRLTSFLTFIPTLQDDGVRVRCCFHHETECIREERVSQEIRVWAPEQVYTIKRHPGGDGDINGASGGSSVGSFEMLEKELVKAESEGPLFPHTAYTSDLTDLLLLQLFSVSRLFRVLQSLQEPKREETPEDGGNVISTASLPHPEMPGIDT